MNACARVHFRLASANSRRQAAAMAEGRSDSVEQQQQQQQQNQNHNQNQQELPPAPTSTSPPVAESAYSSQRNRVTSFSSVGGQCHRNSRTTDSVVAAAAAAVAGGSGMMDSGETYPSTDDIEVAQMGIHMLLNNGFREAKELFDSHKWVIS